MSNIDDRIDFEPARQVPRRTVEAIDDLARTPRRTDDAPDAPRTAGERPVRSRPARPQRGDDPRARNGKVFQLKRDQHYGQYLSVPHGSRSIFAGAEQRSRKRGIVITLTLAAVVIIVLVIILRMTACSG